MNGNDSLLLLFYLLIAVFITPHSCIRSRNPRNRCSAIAVPNGSMTVRHRGRVGRFFCNSGYKLIGDKIATCHEGMWDTNPRCVKDIECPKEMPKVMNGKMVSFNYVFFKVICNPGFKVPDGMQSIFPCEQFFDPLVKPPVCQLTAEQFCDFETDMCNWNNTVPYFSWIRYQNATPSHQLRTGPEGDHTYGTGHYLYIEASGLPSNEERFAKLVRRFWKVDTPEVCFVFWYHMYGFNIGTLDVYVDYAKVFTKNGNQGDKWRKGIIQRLPSDRPDFYITMVATTGNGYAGDIAIDDIGLVNSTDCTKILLIETSCKNRCFEVETNSTLCKCSSECLIESNCCPDFMQTCGADAPKSTTSSETTYYDFSSSSQDVEYSTIVSNYRSSSDGSSMFASSSDELEPTADEPNQSSDMTEELLVSSSQNPTESVTEGYLVSDHPEVTADSVIRITETLKPINKQYTSSNDADMKTDSAHGLVVDSDSHHPTTVKFSTQFDCNSFQQMFNNFFGCSQPLSSFQPQNSATSQENQVGSASSEFGNDGTETWKQPSEAYNVTSATMVAPIVSVALESHEDVSTSQSTVAYNSTTMSNSSQTRANASSIQVSFTYSFSEQYVDSSSTLSGSTVPSSALPSTSKPTSTKVLISTTVKVKPSTTVQQPTDKFTLKPTPPQEKPEKTTSSAKIMRETTSTVRTTKFATAHPVTPSSTHFPRTVASNDGYEDVDESVEPDMITLEPWQEFPSRTTVNNAVNPSQGSYKRRKTYVPKGRYTFSAVRSETKTTTYVSVVAGILIFLSAAFFAGYVFRRRRSNLFHRGGSTEESDVLYMTSDEILDFNMARRPPSSGTSAPSSSQQMLCQTEY